MAPWVFEDEADYVIVGTGAGGATAAKVLAEAGHSVVMLEEGPDLRNTERPLALLHAMRLGMRDMGTETTSGSTPMPLLQGRLVGGSTAINSGIIWRMPEDVRRHWTEVHGLGDLVDEEAQGRIFERMERDLEVEVTTREQLGPNSEKMADACSVLGLPGQPMQRNARRCQGRSRCLQGCPTDARQSMDVSYIPDTLMRGARLHPLSRVDRVWTKRGRAVGVLGRMRRFQDGKSLGRFRVRATRGVIVAAGAIHTPVVLQRSGVKHMVGERFQAHPGCAVVGRFPESVSMAYGAMQGYEVPMRAQGFKLESIALPPEMLAARLPGTGQAWQERLVELDHYGQWCVQVRMKAHGTIRSTLGGRPRVHYEPTTEDVATTKKAVALLCRMMFAAGATEVFPGLGSVPETITSPDQIGELLRAPLVRRDFHLVASHLFGTACAGNDPRRSVVTPGLESHEVRDLYVMDASVFPTNLGVNPQHSIMAVAFRAAEWLANRSAKAAA